MHHFCTLLKRNSLRRNVPLFSLRAPVKSWFSPCNQIPVSFRAPKSRVYSQLLVSSEVGSFHGHGGNARKPKTGPLSAGFGGVFVTTLAFAPREIRNFVDPSNDPNDRAVIYFSRRSHRWFACSCDMALPVLRYDCRYCSAPQRSLNQ